MAKYYITTAIVYPNAKLHIGNMYEFAITDTIARWNRLKGRDTFFLTGTDENTQKVVEAAEKAGKKTGAFLEEIVKEYKELLQKWNITNNDFIRTIEERHASVAQEIFRKIFDKKLVYQGTYEGLYCKGCEAYYTEKDLVDGKCPQHSTVPEKMKEDAYFFKLSEFQGKILELLEKTPFIQPPNRKNELIARIKEQGLKDLCVTRSTTKWGIPCPIDNKHVLYVWFDALINYVSALGIDSKKFKKYWPADVHVIGKDIAWFHAVIWPAILLAAEIKLPKQLLVHGFVNAAEGEKMSKSLGNVLDPKELAEKYTVDALRYFLLREASFGQDIGFSEELLKERLNNELANGLGNLLNRTLSMIEKYDEGTIPKASTSKELQQKLDIKAIEKQLDCFELNQALSKIFGFVAECNAFVNQQKPWAQEKKQRDETLYSLADSLRVIAILLSPFVPETSQKIGQQLGIKPSNFAKCRFNLLKAGTQTKKAGVLFKKIE